MADSDTLSTEVPPDDPRRPQGDEAEFPVVDTERYERGAEFARGGQGRVMTAQDRRLHRQVGIKGLRPSHDAEWRKGFRRGILITARLQHPSIVPMYEAGFWPDGQPF